MSIDYLEPYSEFDPIAGCWDDQDLKERFMESFGNDAIKEDYTLAIRDGIMGYDQAVYEVMQGNFETWCLQEYYDRKNGGDYEDYDDHA